MDRFVILGYAPYNVEYEGKPYSGIRVYVQRLDITPPAGIATDIVKLNSNVLTQATQQFTPECVGQVLEVSYNRYGKPSSFSISVK